METNETLIQIKRLIAAHSDIISWLPSYSHLSYMPPYEDSSIQAHTYGTAMHDDRHRQVPTSAFPQSWVSRADI
jgi:hypothetical protein